MANPIQSNIANFQAISQLGYQTLGRQLIEALEHENDHALRNIFQQPGINGLPAEVLGCAFVKSIQKGYDNYFDRIFELPNAINIVPDGRWGLGHALIEIVKRQDPDALLMLQSHAHFNSILPNSPWGLSQALLEHINVLIRERYSGGIYYGPPDPDSSYLRAIVGHASAREISFNPGLSDLIGQLLLKMVIQGEKRFNKDDEFVIFSLLDSQIAHLLQPNGPLGLGRILVSAAYSTIPSVVRTILSHPHARHISSCSTYTNEKTEFEETWEIGSFGFTETLFAAINNGNPGLRDVPQAQCEIVRSILGFVETWGINLDVNGPYGIADSLTSATENEELVELILKFPPSQTIMANAMNTNSGGLNTALFNAANVGRSLSAQSILRHPNANQISPESLREAINEAQNRGYPETAIIIQAFLNR